MPDDADLSLPALAALIAEFLTGFDLHQVTLVRCDCGDARLVISPSGTDRAANLVLVSCEAFDKNECSTSEPPLPHHRSELARWRQRDLTEARD